MRILQQCRNISTLRLFNKVRKNRGGKGLPLIIHSFTINTNVERPRLDSSLWVHLQASLVLTFLFSLFSFFFFTFIIILQQKWEKKKARPAKGHFPLISFSKKKYIIEPSEKWKAQTTVIRHSVLCLSPPCSPSCRCCLISSSNQATSSLLLSSFSSTTRAHTQKGGYSHHTHTQSQCERQASRL